METKKSWLVPVAKILEVDVIYLLVNTILMAEEVELREPEEYALEIRELLDQAMKSVDELVAELKT